MSSILACEMFNATSRAVWYWRIKIVPQLPELLKKHWMQKGFEPMMKLDRKNIKYVQGGGMIGGKFLFDGHLMGSRLTTVSSCSTIIFSINYTTFFIWWLFDCCLTKKSIEKTVNSFIIHFSCPGKPGGTGSSSAKENPSKFKFFYCSKFSFLPICRPPFNPHLAP